MVQKRGSGVVEVDLFGELVSQSSVLHKRKIGSDDAPLPSSQAALINMKRKETRRETRVSVLSPIDNNIGTEALAWCVAKPASIFGES